MVLPQLSCRLCASVLRNPVIDLGPMPLANGYLRPEQLQEPDVSYPLRAFLCSTCGLLQLEATASPEALFSEYAYFSSVSTTLLAEAEAFANAMVRRLGLSRGHRVVEIACNDGYLLQFFKRAQLNVLGVEPARNVAESAVARGIPTMRAFFGEAVAGAIVAEHGPADLVVANNVIAHVPGLHDFLDGLRTLLSPTGTLTIECHHLLRLVEDGQFDNIYHEHFQYFSLTSARRALECKGLLVVDVEEIPAQGGSLRIYAQHARTGAVPSPAVEALVARERAARVDDAEVYRDLDVRAVEIRAALRQFLETARLRGKTVVCFGAAAKGNTLLNYCGIDGRLVAYAADSSPHKQGLFLPGSRLPVQPPSRVFETRPDYVLVLPWNLCQEITTQLAGIRDWGGQFVTALPALHVRE